MSAGGPAPGCSPEATPAKEAGNKAFAAKQFEEAYQHFSEAIRLDARSALLRSNRAGALASMGRHAEALADAEVCCLLQPDWWKGHSRKGHAQFNLELFAESEASFQEALRLNPGEKSIAEGLERAAMRRKERGQGPAAGAGLRGTGAASGSDAPPEPNVVEGGDFKRLSQDEVQNRFERGVDQLTDAELDSELRKAGVNLPEDASRAVRVRLYLDICALEKAKAAGASAPSPAPLPQVKRDFSTKGEQMLDRRKRWLEEWSTWDDEKLKKRLRKLGFDAEGLARADLIDLLLQTETERANRKTCTPQRLQICGMVSAGVAIAGTFLVVAAVFTMG